MEKRLKKGTLMLSIFMVLCLAILPAQTQSNTKVVIGSKKFTESVILGEMISHLVRHAGALAIHRRELGGTQILWNALRKGDIHVYPEYTGTIIEEILSQKGGVSRDTLIPTLEKLGILISRPIGFNNTYIIGMKAGRAASLNISKISDLALYPELRFGFSNEFMDRQDGWPSLKAHYNLVSKNVRGLDHDLAYRGLEGGIIDIIDLYSTDAEIQYYNIRRLEDDLNHFRKYEAVILYRKDLKTRAPIIVNSILQLEGRINETQMIRLNAGSKLNKIPESQVAADFLAESLSIKIKPDSETPLSRLLKRSKEHLLLVFFSLFSAILVSLPLGIIAARFPRIGQIILGVTGLIQTIPSLALLVFMIPLLGIGGPPALMALFLYSLLPIVRNTYTGLQNIPAPLLESAKALGLPDRAILFRIELPLAASTILAGIKTSAVINVGTATLGALIGAGGYGQPILTGIRLDDTGLILQGAIPAAALAILVQLAFTLMDRFLIPKGLRLRKASN